MPSLSFLRSLCLFPINVFSPHLSHLQLSAFTANIITLRTRQLYNPLDHFNIVDLLDPPIARASLLRNPIDSIFSGYANRPLTNIPRIHSIETLGISYKPGTLTATFDNLLLVNCTITNLRTTGLLHSTSIDTLTCPFDPTIHPSQWQPLPCQPH